MKLLTRDEFRNSVFARDKNQCIYCEINPAQDAHHIMERRLFDGSGGYYIENGASLCGDCHIKAEQTLISPDDLYEKLGTKRVLPEHLYEDYRYTKWGDIQNSNGSRVKGELFYDESVQKILSSANLLNLYSEYIKYPRTFHAPFSLGRSDDDKVLKDYSGFEGREVVVTVKLDGESTSGYSDGYIHARSLDSNNHESRNYIKNLLNQKLYELPKGWRVCGENLYAKHSIHYNNLKSYFYMFSIWNDKNECLSWDETEEWAKLLDIQIVPVLYRGIWNESTVKGLYTEQYEGCECEGFVFRVSDKFSYSTFKKHVGKFVRESHIQTNQHWIKTRVVKNVLQNI